VETTDAASAPRTVVNSRGSSCPGPITDMTSPVVAVRPETPPVQEIADLMLRERISGLPLAAVRGGRARRATAAGAARGRGSTARCRPEDA
jgi:hypothetical protein